MSQHGRPIPRRVARPALRSSFFSSRRRHPRCVSDWSSDVCSSDLIYGFCQFGKGVALSRVLGKGGSYAAVLPLVKTIDLEKFTVHQVSPSKLPPCLDNASHQFFLE